MSIAKLHVTGSAHAARFGEDFDQVLAELIATSHDPTVAADQLDELNLLTVLAQYAAAGEWNPRSPDSDLVAAPPPNLIPSDLNPAVRFHRFAVFHQPGHWVDLVTFEGYALRSDQTVVHTAALRTVRSIQS